MNTANLDVTHLTQTQITALKQSLATLQGKKFFIFKGQVLLVKDLDIQISNTNNVISMVVLKNGVSKGSLVLLDLRGLSRPTTCNPYGPWYDYMYCFLENRAKVNPGASFGEDAGLLNEVRSYLDNRFLSSGGADQNFAITGEGTYISVEPNAVNNLTGLDQFISLSFANDPLVYDKDAILEYLQVYKDEITDNAADVFYVAADDVLEPMSVYDINDIMVGSKATTLRVQATGALQVTPHYPSSTGQSFDLGSSASPQACYDNQSGSVIPCNKQIDWIKPNWRPILGVAKFPTIGAFKKLSRLGYWFNTIDAKEYSRMGIDFLGAIVRSQGQIMLYVFHGYPQGGGFSAPFGCVTPQHIKDGSFLNSLNSSGLFNSPLAKDDIKLTHCACAPSEYAWGIRLSDTKIGIKGIQAGYQCYGSLGKINARAYYLNLPNLPGGDYSYMDMYLFTKYLLGLGPDEAFYSKYPPRLKQVNNVNVNNILDYGGPFYSDHPFHPYSKFRFICHTTAQGAGPNGEDVDGVHIPCVANPDGAAHLFPYITTLSLGTDSRVYFSDDIAQPPQLDFKVKGRNAIESGPAPEWTGVFSFRLIPEVEVVDEWGYKDYYKKGKDTKIPKSILTIKGATASANGIEMVGNPLASHTAEDIQDAPAYKQPYFPYNKYFWQYNARASDSGALHEFKANVPYKLHPWVSNLQVGRQFVEFDFSSDVAPASPCQVLSVDASQCTNLKAIYAKDGSPKFINSDQMGGNDALQFALDDDTTLLGPGDTLIGPDGNEVAPEDWEYALTVTLSGVQSYRNHFPLQGNNGKPSYWYLDRDHNRLVDVFEGNSDTFPQTEGSFKVYIPCAPRKSACCIKNEYGDYSTCADTTAEDCKAKGGTFSDGNNCLKYNYFGAPGPDGQMKGMCPAHCQQQPQAFKYAKTVTNDNCVCGSNLDGSYIYCPDYSSTYRDVAGYSFGSDEMKCSGTFSAGSTGYGFNKKSYSDSCSGEETYQTATAEDHGPSMPVEETQEPRIAPTCDYPDDYPGPWDTGYPENSGSIGCTGGSLTQKTQCYGEVGVCTSTVTVAVSDPLCPADKYAARDDRGNIKCCKLNEELDKESGICKPIYTSQYCSPTPTPSPSPSPTPTPSASLLRKK